MEKALPLVEKKILPLEAGKVVIIINSVEDLTDKNIDLARVNNHAIFQVNLEAKNSYRQNHSAIDALFFIRCQYKLINPAVCLGFEPLGQILNRQPANLILTSPGTRYFQLPITTSSAEFTELIPKPLTKSDFEALKKFLKGAFSFEQFRHREANWWGILVQWKIHEIIIPSFIIPRPAIITEKNKELNNVVAKFLYLNKKNPTNNDFSEISSLQGILDNRSPKILQIDDQAKDGWAEIFRYMIYGDLRPNRFEMLGFKSTDSIKEIFAKLTDLTNPTDKKKIPFIPDVILLDVRLLPSIDDTIKIVHQLSGPELLKLIREEHPGIPVIITTASNKVWTFEELMKLGADGYWIKEGLDDHKSVDDSIDNYKKLLLLVKRTTDSEYKVLHSLSLLLEDIVSKKNNWWEKANANTWATCELIDSDTKEIEKLLLSCIILIRTYLTQYYLGYGYDDGIHPSFFLSSIINKLGNVVEIIHGIKKDDYIKGLKIPELISKRQDQIGREIRSKRNTASHGEYAVIHWSYFVHYINDVIRYLTNFTQPKCTSIVPTSTIKKHLYKKR